MPDAEQGLVSGKSFLLPDSGSLLSGRADHSKKEADSTHLEPTAICSDAHQALWHI